MLREDQRLSNERKKLKVSETEMNKYKNKLMKDAED